MGLDQYAYRVRKNAVVNPLKFKSQMDGVDTYEEIQYWRKVPNLQGWMEQLYRKKGGTAEDFNCTPVQLTEADLDNLEKDVKANKLPATSGFFFGTHYDSDMPSILTFIEKARAVLKEGDAVYYDSWW